MMNKKKVKKTSSHIKVYLLPKNNLYDANLFHEQKAQRPYVSVRCKARSTDEQKVHVIRKTAIAKKILLCYKNSLSNYINFKCVYVK